MNRPSLRTVPRAKLQYWGVKSAPAIDFACEQLNRLGFSGPVSWRERAIVTFHADLSPEIRTSISLSCVSAEKDYALFTCAASLHSKTIQALSRADDPWIGGAKQVFDGYEPCLVIRLEHQKWCERESEINPSWAMSLNGDTQCPGVKQWLTDFERLMLPCLRGLKDDDALDALLTRCVERERPPWVKSDPPFFAFLPLKLARLRMRREPSVERP